MSLKLTDEEPEQRIRKLEQAESKCTSAEKALRESEDRYNALVKDVPFFICSFLPSGEITFVNKAYCEYFNKTFEELVGSSFLSLIPASNQKNVMDNVSALTVESPAQSHEHSVIAPDGDIRWHRWTNRALFDGRGKVVGYQSIGEDITERKQVQEALRESEERYRNLFELSPDGIVIWQYEKAALVNPAATRMFGATSIDQIIGKSIYEIHPVEDKDKVRMRLEYVQETGFPAASTEYKLIRLDGRLIDVEATGTLITYKKHPAILSLYRDVSKRKQAEEALRLSHETFLTVLNSIDATIYVADMDTCEILFMNKYMIESFGGDLTGAICWKVFRGGSGPCAGCTNNRLVDDHGNPTGVYIWQGKNPVTGRWYVNYDRAIQWIDDRRARIQIATDITEIKKLEEERRFSEEKLRQVQKMESIGTLAGGVAHDFNNLLMGIQGRASLMSVDLEPSHPLCEHINAIEDYIRSATDLTRQLLGFARGGKYEVRPIDINDLLLNSATMFGRTKKEIRIHTNLHSPPPMVSADRRQIEQVLLNLYVNAWQAMPDGGELYLGSKVVTLDDGFCEPYQTKPGRYAKVTVTDTGIGMDASIHQRIFDPFFTTKEKERGIGLGLASAYGIIKNHNGIITVDSEVGRGTAFNIYLPESDQKAHREDSEAGGLIKGSETILLVDDEKMIIDVGQAMLEKLGYRIVVAKSGEQAIDTVKSIGDEIDLIILDLIMPGIKGGKVLDLIREIQPSIPVLLSSGYSLNGQTNDIMRRRCNGFIQKPFNISDLSQEVRKILDETKGHAEA
jgi:PAS domain S-box-containing protein